MAKYLLLITILVGCLMTFVSANDETFKEIAVNEIEMEEVELNLVKKAIKFLWKSGQSSYTHVWPDMKFGWEIIVGSLIGFLGAAFGSVGGVGGGGFFVPMLTLVIGFDSKSSAAISKCMIMGTAASTVYYNLKQRHPTLDMPIVDYDLALLFQPVLVLGISIGVAFNVVLADWMITVLLNILFVFTSIKAFFKGVDAWKKESITKKEVAQRLLSHGDNNNYVLSTVPNKREVSIMKDVNWPIVDILFAVWFAILGLEITQKYTSTCTIAYWTINLLQIPIALGASGYEAYMLYHGKRESASRGDVARPWKIQQLIICMTVGVCAGIVGGLLGVGGGSILGPLFLELGVPPQVSSATATFAMMFSSSMSVVEYYLLKRFPVPYAAYFVIVATFSALVGQVLVKKLIAILGRASLIIFVFSFTVFVSAISLGGVGISNMVYKIQHNEYMGFDSLCTYDV